jgi:hypothetical protein
MDSRKESRLLRHMHMARPDPDKLTQALRANLRRRKAPPAPTAPPEPPESPETAPQKPSTGQG